MILLRANVSGGDCNGALAAAINMNTSSVLAALGDYKGATFFAGMAAGNLQTPGCNHPGRT